MPYKLPNGGIEREIKRYLKSKGYRDGSYELRETELIAIARPGWDWPEAGPVAALLEHRGASAEQLQRRPAGRVCVEALRPQSVSSTAIRRLLQSGRSVRYLTPDSVIDYIDRHGLYRPAADATANPAAQATQE